MSISSYQLELSIIKQIAVVNGFSHHLIDTILKNKLKKISWANLTTLSPFIETKKYIPLSFIGPSSYKIANVFKEIGFNIGFSTINNLKSRFVKNKDKIAILDKSGVYEIKCNDCNASYIGKTGRAFKVRIKEHTDGKHRSHFFDHLFNTNHNFDIQSNFKPLVILSAGNKLNSFEELAISINNIPSNNLLNTQLFFPSSQLFNIFKD